MNAKDVNAKDVLPTKASVGALLEEIEPASTCSAIRSIGAEFANGSFLVEATTRGGTPLCLVIKRYVDHDIDAATKARLEYRTLTMLQAHGVPAPPPLYLDESGMLFGAPALVTRYMSGKSMLSSPDALHCARALARTLAQIHSVPCASDSRRFLHDGNTLALWFLNPGDMPDYIRDHPDGLAVWQAVHERLPQFEPDQPVLVHMDYWMGNMLWDQGQIVAVFDWEEASYGDPAIDLAYCRMDMYLSKMGKAAADELLAVYEAEMGRRVANLAFWELAAVPRPLHDPDWLAVVREELAQFVANIP